MISLGSRYDVLRKPGKETLIYYLDTSEYSAVFTAHWSLNINGKMIKVDKHTKPWATMSAYGWIDKHMHVT